MSENEKRPDTLGRMQPVKAPARANAAATHGAKSEYVLAPQVRNQKRDLLRRMGMRQAELTWAGRETLNLYARTLAKLRAIDDFLLSHPMLDEDGKPAPCMALYSTLLNTASRQLGDLRAVVADMAREDDRYDTALSALAAEGRRIRTSRDDDA